MVASPSGRRNYTLQEYLAIEENSREKHEYFRGTIFAMAGGSPQHVALSTALTAILLARLEGKPCMAYGSDLRLSGAETELYTYADASVVCGELQLDPKAPSNVTNPVIVFEVLSESTEKYDRGEKRELYQRNPFLREYVLVAQDRRLVEVYARKDIGADWIHTVYIAGETVLLPSIDVRFPVDELYERARVNVA